MRLLVTRPATASRGLGARRLRAPGARSARALPLMAIEPMGRHHSAFGCARPGTLLPQRRLAMFVPSANAVEALLRRPAGGTGNGRARCSAAAHRSRASVAGLGGRRTCPPRCAWAPLASRPASTRRPLWKRSFGQGEAWERPHRS